MGSVLPPLRFLIGTGKPFNMLVTNKWYSLKLIPKITKVPMLMLVSGQVRECTAREASRRRVVSFKTLMCSVQVSFVCSILFAGTGAIRL